MNKNVYLAIAPSDNSKQIANFDTVNINQINTIFPCSLDVLYIDSLNFLSNDNVKDLLESAIDKVKPKGHMIVQLLDLKKICSLYVNGNLEESKFLQYMKLINTSFNYMDIVAHSSNKNYQISEIKKDTISSIITLSKIGV
jgi:hypothetical protein